MTIIGVIGCTALLVSAFGMYDGMNDLKEWEFNQINHYDSKLIIDDNASISDVDDVADEVDGDNITLVLPVWKDNKIDQTNDIVEQNLYFAIDKEISKIINSSYQLLSGSNIKVESKIFVMT